MIFCLVCIQHGQLSNSHSMDDIVILNGGMWVAASVPGSSSYHLF